MDPLDRSPSLAVCRPLRQRIAKPAADMGFRSFHPVNILSNCRLCRCLARAMTSPIRIAPA